MTPTFSTCDFHVHTELSGEKQAEGLTIERLFTEADALGLTHVGCNAKSLALLESCGFDEDQLWHFDDR